MQNEVDTLRSDNVKLYEKIKFLQSYPTKVTLLLRLILNSNQAFVLWAPSKCALREPVILENTRHFSFHFKQGMTCSLTSLWVYNRPARCSWILLSLCVVFKACREQEDLFVASFPKSCSQTNHWLLKESCHTNVECPSLSSGGHFAPVK